MGHLHPISLCNVLYKLGLKVLANSFKLLLPSIILLLQSASVLGRLIYDNTLVAFEMAHFLKRQRAVKKGYCALKLDLSKAYDKVEWLFLERVMEQMGFAGEWISLVMGCVKTVSYSFILDGEARGRVFSMRGLRQGDSISPYLFTLCMEGLSYLVSAAVAREPLHGVTICRGAPCISHLFFTEDSFIFFKVERAECEEIHQILLLFIEPRDNNFQKNCASFSKNVKL